MLALQVRNVRTYLGTQLFVWIVLAGHVMLGINRVAITTVRTTARPTPRLKTQSATCRMDGFHLWMELVILAAALKSRFKLRPMVVDASHRKQNLALIIQRNEPLMIDATFAMPVISLLAKLRARNHAIRVRHVWPTATHVSRRPLQPPTWWLAWTPMP
jgi:hypothetical protein